jgi:membrane protein required for beta-lactamase induction
MRSDAGLIGALPTDAAMLIFAFLMRESRNWVRIMLAVLGSLRLLVLLFVLLAGVVFGVLTLLVGTAMVMIFLPTANSWLRPRQTGP